ncbi:MAG: hypothetical protein Q7T73_16360 [Beijerinckiaceae bacterium]|nr:hypothetical protein [Beijerinckiaceae bacterium]
MSLPSLISVAHSGGQGKTTFAQLLYLFTKQQKLAYQAVSADFLDRSARSKFGKLYPDQVLEIGIGADIKAARLQNDAGAAVRYWDSMGKLLIKGGNVIDLGANVIPGLIDWATDRRFPQLMDQLNVPPVEFFCVARDGRHAIEDISSVVEKLTEPRLFRNTRFYIVKNEAGGSFKDNMLERKLHEAFPLENFYFLTMPACHSEIWNLMEGRGISIETALTFNEERAMAELGCDIWSASSGLGDLRA